MRLLLYSGFAFVPKLSPTQRPFPYMVRLAEKPASSKWWAFLFSGPVTWNPERGKPFAIDAQNDNPKAIQHQSTNAVRALGMRSSNVQRSSFRLELQQSSEVERNWSRIRVQRQGCEQSQNAEDDEKVF